MLLSSAVCLLLLQGALGYTAVVSGGSVNPDRSVQPTSSAAPENWARRTRDVVFFMQNITFPENPTPGALFEYGGDTGTWAGIRTFSDKPWFQVQVGKKNDPQVLPTGDILRPGSKSAVVMTENFPKDGGLHDVLIHIRLGSSSPGNEGSVRVFIDCEEIGTGFTIAGQLDAWADGNSGAYLEATGSSPSFTTPEGRAAWSGGTAGAGPLHIYFYACSIASPV